MASGSRCIAGKRPASVEFANATPPTRTISLACIAILLVVHGLWFAHLFSGLAVDDAYISFRYATNLIHGHGLVFNPGERVEGYSNFLAPLENL